MIQATSSEMQLGLITGVSSGFGKTCAEHLSSRGYRVYGTSRWAHYDAAPLTAANGQPAFITIPMDVRDPASVNRAIAHILEKEGRLDVDEQNGPPPGDVALLLEKIIRNPARALRYPVGKISNRIAAALKTFLPGKIYEWLIMKNYKLH